ncbi:MAG: hypothetical protein HUK24_05100, partial [Sphaerochaetaceae bacterium]|nr:hypothetical protein [Sphaerochaetaceae bacterium]
MENFAIIDNNKICIKLCGSDTPHLGMLLNHKEVLLYFKDGKLIPVTYERIGDIKDSRYLILNSEGIINEVPVSALELPNSLKKDAFKLITNLAQALEIIDSSSPKSLNFTAPWLFYSLPLNGVWFTKDGGVLLFPKQVTDIIDTFISDDERNINWKRFFVHNTVEDYGKAHF